MLGLIVTLLFAIGATGVGKVVLGRLTSALDPALAFAVHGLGGLAVMGMITLPVALLPGGTHWGVYIVGAIALAGYYPFGRSLPKFQVAKGPAMLVILGAILVFGCSLVGVLSPSDANDWDTLAYHLAVPKIYLIDGQMHFISFIHHSNFPFTIDGLYIWGLEWGGEAGAKAFSLMFGILGAAAIFGIARQRYGSNGGWIALLGYLAIPMVLWECGTGYIDIGNGLFVALGVLFAAEYASDSTNQNSVWLSGIFIGLAAGSKYTGLQTIFAVTLALIALCFIGRKDTGALSIKGIAIIAVLAMAIASPWYIKNVINTGNPVYPFFYSVFKGKNWDAFSDQIYRHQQQTFGAGRESIDGKDYTENPLKPTRIGAAVLGLAYQPGRYADPAPTLGAGLPFVSLGAFGLIAMLFWFLSGSMTRFESLAVAVVLVSLGLWFFLSEQSRYIVGLIFVLTVLGGGAASKLKLGVLLTAAGAIQLIASVFFFTRYGDPNPTFSEKLKVVLGTTSPDDYQKRFVSFYTPSQDINRQWTTGRVALYDEVFGFFLDVPYFWANPGHTTEMGYEQMSTVDQLLSAYKRLDISKVYINLGQTFGHDPKETALWLDVAGLGDTKQSYDPADRVGRMKDPQNKYKVLLAEAVGAGKLSLVQRYGTRLLFSVQ